LSAAVTWPRFEQTVLAVFAEALRRLAARVRYPAAEEPINLELYWLAVEVHHALMNSRSGSMPFVILFDSTNQPEPDDAARSQRLRKRPDFTCAITNSQAADYLLSQLKYYLECKRLGRAEGNWVFNENYTQHGVVRFMHTNWQYGKGCTSATMIGYLQNMDPDDVFAEVDKFARARSIPSLQRAMAWAARDVTRLSQPPLQRDFAPAEIQLGHLWVDLQHCHFEKPPAKPPTAPKAAKSKRPKAKVATAKKQTQRGTKRRNRGTVNGPQQARYDQQRRFTG
jgi:hypothetical protein